MSSSSAVGNDNSLVSVMARLVNVHDVNMPMMVRMSFNDSHMRLLMMGLNYNYVVLLMMGLDDHNVWLHDGVMSLNHDDIVMRVEDTSSNNDLLLNMDVQNVP